MFLARVEALRFLACLRAGEASAPCHRSHRKTTRQIHISHICHNKQGTAGCGQRAEDERDSTAAHQQAPAVAEPPAAVLSGQHEGEGLAVGKDQNI